VCALLGWAGWAYYLKPRGDLDGQLEAARKQLLALEAEAEREGVYTKRLRELAATGLGTKEEEVSANLRTALGEMGEAYGLRGVKAATLSPAPVRNPAAARGSEFSGSAGRGARESTDFFAMGATVEGDGSLAQCVGMLAALSSQEWAHRLTAVTLRPTNKERTGFRLAVSLVSMYMPDAGALPERAALWRRPAKEEEAAWRGVVAKNVFREPVPEKPAVAQNPSPAPAAPAAPVGPTYADYRVAGVARGVKGPELLLVNTRDNQRLTLLAGEKVLEAVFLGGAGETARLSIGNEVFEVSLNERLDQRRKVGG
jgi:hypothetical protein